MLASGQAQEQRRNLGKIAKSNIIIMKKKRRRKKVPRYRGIFCMQKL